MRFGPFTLFEKKSLAIPEDWLMALFGVSTTAAGASVTATSALEVPAVSAAVTTIADAAATLDVSVKEVDEKGIETPIDHPANALLRGQANDWTSGFELIRALMVDALTRDTGGLAWVNWVDGKPVEIIKYLPGIIEADTKTNNTGEPIYRIGSVVKPMREIVHVRGPFDRCPVSLARESIGIAAVMETHAARLFGTGAKPGGILRTKKPLGDEGVKRMLAGWKAAHEGAASAGKTAVLWDDAEWQQMTLSSVDAQFQQLWLFAIQEIARAFNIPAPMLGDLSRATWSNSEQKGREFLSYCLEPWLRALEGAFARALFTPEERARLVVRFDRDDLTRADLTARATAISSLVSSRTINPNEGRAWLGLGPYVGGNAFANPNTGSSQPGDPQKSTEEPKTPADTADEEDPADA